MSFKWITKMCVESDAGFVVHFTGRFTMVYREGEKTLTLDVDNGAEENGLRNILISPSAFGRWDGASADQRFSEEELTRIIENISRAFLFQGLKMVLEEPEQLSLSDLKKLSPKFRDGGTF